MSTADLLIVGGGPAGAALAILASEAGLGVTLIEAKPFPRDKVCGEFISAEGVAVLDRLGLWPLLKREGALPVHNCRISDLQGRCLDLPLPASLRSTSDGAPLAAATGFSRARLDAALLERAAESGARILQPCRATRPLMEDDRVVGVEAGWRKGSKETLLAKTVIAADGRKSMLLRALRPDLGDPTRTDTESFFGLKAHWSRRRDCLAGRVDLHLFPGGYVGLGEIEGERINLCMMVRVSALNAAGKSPDRVVEQGLTTNPAFLDALGAGNRCSDWHSVGPLRFGPRIPSIAGMLLIGDAAGTIDPFCGEGISNALLGAELALPHAIRAAERGGVDRQIADDYSRTWNRRFRPVIRRVRAVGWGFERPTLAGGLLAGLRGPVAGLAPKILAATRTGFAEAP